MWISLTSALKTSYSDRGTLLLTSRRFLNGFILLARNIVCFPRGAELAEQQSFSAEVLKLVIYLLGKDVSDELDKKLFRSCFQFLSNMVSADQCADSLKLLLDNLDSTATRNLSRHLNVSDPAALPILLFLQFSLAPIVNAKEIQAVLLDNQNGQEILRHIMSHCNKWLNDGDAHFASILKNIMSNFVASGGIVLILKKLSVFNTAVFQRLSLLKLLDAVLPGMKLFELRENLNDLTAQMYQELVDAEAMARPFITGSSEVTDDELIFNVWNTLSITLDIWSVFLNVDASVKEFLVINGLQLLLELLGDCQKHLPVRNKLADIPAKEAGSLNPKEFPLVKSKIIEIVGLLAIGNPHVQDEVRRLHGLEVILSNCIIDRNNPFVRETSILALKYILQDNYENQNFVSQLEAKGTATEEALEEAGYETEFVDGKLRLKSLKR